MTDSHKCSWKTLKAFAWKSMYVLVISETWWEDIIKRFKSYEVPPYGITASTRVREKALLYLLLKSSKFLNTHTIISIQAEYLTKANTHDTHCQ